ncbi:MAG: rhomboid family intramembrane serine protease [Mariniblastus sp.]|nr:rhomboid family intramembrane serine protease [Mariniblastus sp.]
MLFFYPTGTDAPIYHWPFATGGLILINIAVLILQYTFPETAQGLLLQYGSFNPLSWLTSIFMHADVVHLVSNIIGIALFGWIIEGKIGWWRLIAIYLVIGVSSSAFEQTIMLMAPNGSSLGASGVVFGLIAIAMIWAPENEITIGYLIVVFWRPIWGSFEVTVLNLGFLMIAIEFVTAAFTMFHMSSAVLHLMGAIPGFAIAVLMLKLRRVDCDGYDMISLWTGKRGERTLTVEQENELKDQANRERLDRQRLLNDGLEKIDGYINHGHYDMALKRFEMLRKKKRSLKMTESQLVTIIKAYDKNPETKLKSVPVIQTYLEHYDSHKIPFTLMLARTHILVQDRPRLGLKRLKQLNWKDLTSQQQDFVRNLIERAKAMIADGILEVDDS